MSTRKLSAKQRLFIEHMLSEDCFGNATESARRAGYAGNDVTLAAVGYANIRKPQIAAELQAKQEKIFAGAGVTIENVLVDLQRIGKKAEADGQYGAAGNMAIHQGKYLKMFVDRIEQVRVIEDTTDAELIAGIREDCEALGIDPEPIIIGYFGTDAAEAGAPRGETTH